MKRTILAHFYNEEYLLPWWLNHHKKYFNHGIMVNYASTDRSCDIIKEICPTWEIIDSRNTYFSARDVDREIIDIESTIDGWKICLNITEFLVGDYSSLSDQIALYIPCLYFVDNVDLIRDSSTLNYDAPLWDFIKTGLDVSDTTLSRGSRVLHSTRIFYDPGRHYLELINTNDFIIFNYGFAPMTEEFIARKLQIEPRMPLQEKIKNVGWKYGDPLPEDLSRDKLLRWYKEYSMNIVTDKPVNGTVKDLTGIIHSFVDKL